MPYDLAGIAGVTADSRACGPGHLFAALPGVRADGRAFIADAVARGAAAVLAPPGTPVPPGARLIPSDDPRRDFARIAAQFHGAQPGVVAAVTGTNGKTSTVQFARQLWALEGHTAAALGTLEGAMTTPDAGALHARLAEMARGGVTHLALEASSHGLDQRRLDGVRLAAAAFTNLTRDHLDYHGTMEAYCAAKLRLFADLLPPGAPAIVCADDPSAPAFMAAARGPVVTYGHAGAELRIARLTPLPHGLRAELEIFGQTVEVTLPLIGAFQASNALAALGLVAGDDAPRARALAARLEGLTPAPGRMERVGAAPVYVDYAHTPAGLETALTALRPHVPGGRIVCVFGCGGARDTGKRPQMGAIAARLADAVIITDDNPRGEDPAAIRTAILAAAPGAQEVGDRRAAIAAGIALLRPGDALLIAGKGHETGQTIAGTTHPFHDATVAKEILGK
jgi:UDP-N-acetylmuramoyl-L-alanyl-D-glutamate--2,6-diaminopimelate ligase